MKTAASMTLGGAVALIAFLAGALAMRPHLEDSDITERSSDTVARADLPPGYDLRACLADLERLEQVAGVRVDQVRGAPLAPEARGQ